MKFKVGDKVKVVNLDGTGLSDDGKIIGHTTTIITVLENLRLSYQSKWGYWFGEENLDFTDEEKIRCAKKGDMIAIDDINKVPHPICPLNLYFEGDNIERSKCDYNCDTRGCTEQCKILNKNIEGIKVEGGKDRIFSTGAKRQPATGKGTPVLLPPDALMEIAKHLENASIHYGLRNWEKGIPLSEILNSLLRHIFDEIMGDTSERHDRAIGCNTLFYIATKLRIEQGLLPKELNDLPKYKKVEND